VIDWDNIESDPTRELGRFDEEDKKYIKRIIATTAPSIFTIMREQGGRYKHRHQFSSPI